MNSRALWAAVATVGFLMSCSDASTAAVSVTLPSSIPSSSSVVKDNFVGISLELNILDFLIGPTPNAIPIPMKNYLINLRSRTSNNLRLRLGGNSLDGSIYNPNATKMISFNLAPPSGGVKNVPVTYGPQVLTTLNHLGAEIGGISHLLGINFAYPQNDSDVVLFAEHAQTLLGSSIDAFIVGNEPDLYQWNGKRDRNYNIVQYSADLNKVAADLVRHNTGIELASPTTCCDVPNWSLSDALNVTLGTEVRRNQKYVTLQHYPHTSCNVSTKTSWDITYFTNHTNVQQLVQWSQDGINIARNVGLPVILTEFNSASCGGEPGLSNTFAAVLWTIDYLLGLAGNGYEAAYIHTREPGVLYNLFTYPDSSQPSSTGWQTGLQYYSLLFVAEALSTKQTNGTSIIVVDLNLNDTTAQAGYAIYDANATTSLPRDVVFFNFAAGTTREFSLPSDLVPSWNLSLRVRTLRAPSLTENSTAQVTYAGQTVNGNGDIQGIFSEENFQCQKGCKVQVPGPGVSVVFFELGDKSSNSGASYIRPSASLALTGSVLVGMILGYVM